MSATILIVILGIFIVLWLFADWQLYNHDKPTVTQVVIRSSHRHPIVAWLIGFAMGALTGHFYL